MVDFDVRPRVTVIRSLLQVKRLELVGLSGGPRHKAIEHGGIPVDARAVTILNVIAKCVVVIK